MAHPQSHAARRLMGIQSRHRQYQDGGQVRGPGTSTSDSIAAKLSDGEFVLPTDTVRKVGVKSLRDLVHATHTPVKAKTGRHNYANGGLATDDEQKRPNSFGDAAAAASNPGVTQVGTAPAPVATPAAEPAATVANIPQPALQSVPAGAKSFGDAAAAARDSSVAQVPTGTQDARTRLLGSDAIPTGGLKAPAPDGSQEQWRNTEIGRNVNNTMMALPGIGGLPRVASTGGAISSGFNNAAAPGVNAASRMMALGSGVAAPGTQAAPNPYASVTPEQGRDMAQINAKAQSPMAVMPAAAQQPMGGITRIDRPGHSPLFTDNKDPDMARFLARPAGGPTKEVSDIMQRMSDQSQNEAFARFQKEANAAQYAKEVQQAQSLNASAGEHSRSVQNRMDQEKYLRTLDVNGSSKAYHAALAQDAGFRAGADAGSVARTQNEGSSARERMQQMGATERAQMQEVGQNGRFGQTQGLARDKFGLEQTAAGYQNRGAQRIEKAQQDLEAAGDDPAKQRSARQRLLGLMGKQDDDAWQGIALQGATDVHGNKTEGVLAALNKRTGDVRRLDQQSTQSTAPADGARVRGKDGLIYVVRNGQPILER